MVGPTLGSTAMSGVCSRHLERRCGIYGFRVRVPDGIRPLIGMVEVRRSLRTSDPLRARALAALIAVRLFEVFDMVRQQDNWVTEDDVRAMIAQTFDQMARSISAGQGFPHTKAISNSANTNARVGATVGEALGSYLTSKKPVWTAKTLTSRVRKLSYLREFLGADTPLNLISPDDVRSFRDAITSMRANKGLCRAASFASRRTDSVEHRIDPKTATLNFEPAKAFFRWCNAEQGYIAVNPAENIRMTLSKKRKGDKPRRPFSADELHKLFSSPLFTGCQSRCRRFERGSTIIKDAKYWLPVLGYYTGARLGELVQLHIRDIEFSGPVPCLHITEQNAGKVGGPEAKHVKSDAGVRRIPLHPDLTALGFQHFVEARRLASRSSKRLFHEVNFA